MTNCKKKITFIPLFHRAGIMTHSIREVIIPKEEAVFWLDKAGCWRNEGGKFRNKKIIDYFHASIGKDDGGYFVSHRRDDMREKVYFLYEDTALFVFDVLLNGDPYLILNTGKKVPLNPAGLYIRSDHLYTCVDNEPVKFSERAMTKLAPCVLETDGQLFFEWNGTTHPIPET